MRALLLAAGLGTRLRPLTLTVPKCLVPVRGKPLLDYWLEHLFAAGIERVLINTHLLAFRTDVPQSCGILELGDDRVVVGFHEKVANPPGNLANAAVYIFEPEVMAFIASLERPVVDLSTEVIPAFIGRIYATETTGYHRDIGSPEALRLAEYECREWN
jgi:NDP-sugar pyrophosphorylase family protein